MGDVGTRILVVDRDERQAEKIALALVTAGYQVTCKADSLHALMAVETERPALVVLSWEMPFIDGSTFVHALRAGMAQPPPVVAIADPAIDPDGIRRQGAGAWLAAPPDTETLVRLVRRLLGRGQPVWRD